jgi:hypothetical protein
VLTVILVHPQQPYQIKDDRPASSSESPIKAGGPDKTLISPDNSAGINLEDASNIEDTNQRGAKSKTMSTNMEGYNKERELKGTRLNQN